MDAERFDRWTRGLDTVVTRRGVGAIATGALGVKFNGCSKNITEAFIQGAGLVRISKV